jgi:hypothetical protein
LTTLALVVILSNMNAKLTLRERHIISEISFVEMVVWHLPAPLSGSSHRFKYRLALVVNGICVLRYDNEAGKGDHKHKAGEESPYLFSSPQALLGDFWQEVDNWRS